MTASTLRIAHLWRDGAWQADASVHVDAQGRIVGAGPGEAPVATAAGWVLPGMPNLHSHAFQRAMAGLAERRGQSDDSFWTWREAMYAFASRIGPEQLQAIAAQLYVEMLKAGYTHVCEFHYLHHQPDGTPYAGPAAMSRALIEAAREAGIGMTLLPVLYMRGGFDGRALAERQRRFRLGVQDFLELVEMLRVHEGPALRVGMAIHSLRAVSPLALSDLLEAGPARQGPLHIHVAEQIGEVQDCLAAHDTRPVQWLLDHAAVDARWCLVHATHTEPDELRALAKTGATVGLCPTTEANLGDGIFPLAAYLDAGGRFGIGSDSHISVSPVEELRWLEYAQRLQSRRRNVAARAHGASVAQVLWDNALQGGARAADAPVGALRPGHRADLLVLDDTSPLLAARNADSMLESFLFAGNTPLVRDVMANGSWVVRDFRHRNEEHIAQRYRRTVERLRSP